MNISHSPIRSLHCLNPAIITSVFFAVSVLPWPHTAKPTATSIVHSKLNYCNSLYYGLPKYQVNRLQHTQNALARTVVQAPKFQHITPILKSLHWLNVSEQTEYKTISLTYKILNTTQPSYLYNLLSIQPPHGHNTRSSPYVTLKNIVIAQSHSSLLPTCFTPSLDPVSYITQKSSSNFFFNSQPPSFEHVALTCNKLLSPSIIFTVLFVFSSYYLLCILCQNS